VSENPRIGLVVVHANLPDPDMRIQLLAAAVQTEKGSGNLPKSSLSDTFVGEQEDLSKPDHYFRR
jgi:hypothetical protein